MGIMQSFPEIQQQKPSYDYLVRRMATESITSPEILGVFKNLIPQSMDLLKSYIPQFNTQSDAQPGIMMSSKGVAVLKKVATVNFVAYEDTLVQVPEGFDGKLVPYLELLLLQSKVVLEHGVSVIKDYNLELSMFLSNKDFRASLKSMSQRYKQIRTEREGYEHQIEAFFDKKHSTVSRKPLGEVIERFTDLKKVYELEEKIASVRKQQNFKAVSSEIQRAADMLALIKGRLDSGDIDNVSGQTAKNLAEGAYEVAKYAEYMSLYAYFMETVTASIKNMTEQFETIF